MPQKQKGRHISVDAELHRELGVEYLDKPLSAFFFFDFYLFFLYCELCGTGSKAPTDPKALSHVGFVR